MWQKQFCKEVFYPSILLVITLPHIAKFADFSHFVKNIVRFDAVRYLLLSNYKKLPTLCWVPQHFIHSNFFAQIWRGRGADYVYLTPNQKWRYVSENQGGYGGHLLCTKIIVEKVDEPQYQVQKWVYV